MKILAFSDLHCHNYKEFSRRLGNGLNSRLRDCLNIVDQAIDVCKSESVELCVFAGDLFVSRDRVSVDVYTETWKAFQQLACTTPLHMLVGNHDQHLRVGEINAMSPFSEFALVFDTPGVIKLEDGTVAGYLPFQADESVAHRWLAKEAPQANIVFMHQGLKEAMPGPTDSIGSCGLSVEDLPLSEVQQFVLGHVHKRQTVGSTGNVHYIGSPLQLTFGERDERKCMSLIDTDDWTVTEVPTDAPKFVQLDVPEDDSDPVGIDFSHSADMARDFVKIKYHKRWQRSIDHLKTVYPRLVCECVKEEQSTVQRVSSETVGDDRALLSVYQEQTGVGNLDTGRLLSVGLAGLAGVEE